MSSLPSSVPLWLHTPLFFSQHLSNILDADVYLKLENVQPSQSFKFRGISLIAQKARDRSPDAHLVIASGGNAGLAAACAAKAVGLACSVYLPVGLDSKFLERLKEQGAYVFEHGVNYDAAYKKAQQVVGEDKRSVSVSAYDDETLWEGHASMIGEISSDLKGIKPDAIFCSVGGGGLLAGIILGCKRIGWDDVTIGALETIGANCFYHSISANRHPQSPHPVVSETKTNGNDVTSSAIHSTHLTTFLDPVHRVQVARLNAITSAASSLGASSPAPGVVRMSLDRKGPVKCVSVPDSLSMHVAVKFAEDHKFLVELACSTTLVPAYINKVFEKIVPATPDMKRKTVIFIVCGGSKISMDDLAKYRNVVNEQTGPWKVFIEGEGEVEVGK